MFFNHTRNFCFIKHMQKMSGFRVTSPLPYSKLWNLLTPFCKIRIVFKDISFSVIMYFIDGAVGHMPKMNQIREGICSPLNMPLMKKALMGGMGAVVKTSITPFVCYAPLAKSILRGGQKIFFSKHPTSIQNNIF